MIKSEMIITHRDRSSYYFSKEEDALEWKAKKTRVIRPKDVYERLRQCYLFSLKAQPSRDSIPTNDLPKRNGITTASD